MALPNNLMLLVRAVEAIARVEDQRVPVGARRMPDALRRSRSGRVQRPKRRPDVRTFRTVARDPQSHNNVEKERCVSPKRLWRISVRFGRVSTAFSWTYLTTHPLLGRRGFVLTRAPPPARTYLLARVRDVFMNTTGTLPREGSGVWAGGAVTARSSLASVVNLSGERGSGVPPPQHNSSPLLLSMPQVWRQPADTAANAGSPGIGRRDCW